MGVRFNLFVSELLLSMKLSERREITRNKLTSEIKIDNLEKFAKTSLVAEVILDRLKNGRKAIERGI